MEQFWKVAVGVVGLGAVVSFVLWSIYKTALSQTGAQPMTKEQQYRSLRMIVVLTFLFAIAGLVAYVVVSRPTPSAANAEEYKAHVERDHRSNVKTIEQAASTHPDSSLAVSASSLIEKLSDQSKDLVEAVDKDYWMKAAEDRRRYNETIAGILRLAEVKNPAAAPSAPPTSPAARVDPRASANNSPKGLSDILSNLKEIQSVAATK